MDFYFLKGYLSNWEVNNPIKTAEGFREKTA